MTRSEAPFQVRCRRVNRYVSYSFMNGERVDFTQVLVEQKDGAGITDVWEPVTPKNIRRAKKRAAQLNKEMRTNERH